MGYYRLSDAVDAVFHCTEVDDNLGRLKNDAQIGMIIHDRSTGKTCFFNQQAELEDFSGNFPKLEDSHAETFWKDPIGNSSFFGDACIQCHANSGPYFIMESAERMAQFGLINNGHDTNFKNYSVVRVDSRFRKSTAQLKASTPYSSSVEGSCGESCHNFLPRHVRLLGWGDFHFQIFVWIGWKSLSTMAVCGQMTNTVITVGLTATPLMVQVIMNH